MQRRTFLASALAAAASSVLRGQACEAADAAASVQQAHSEIWRRFIDKHDVMLDFTELDGSVDLPTPEECREGKPNALGWWSPIENGAMFNGMYLDGMVNRWRHTKSAEDAAKARRLMHDGFKDSSLLRRRHGEGIGRVGCLESLSSAARIGRSRRWRR